LHDVVGAAAGTELTSGARLHEDGSGEPDGRTEAIEIALDPDLWRRVERLAAAESLPAAVITGTVLAVLLKRIADAPVRLWLRASGITWSHVPVARFSFVAAAAESKRQYLAATGAAIPIGHGDTSPFYLFDFARAAEPGVTGSQPCADPGSRSGSLEDPRSTLRMSFLAGFADSASKVRLTFDTGAFSQARARSLLEAYARMLGTVIASPYEVLARLPVAAAHDRGRAWPRRDPRPSCAFADTPAGMTELFETIVRRWPDEIALAWPEGTLTFARLAAIAAEFAGLVQRHGAARGDVIAFRLTSDAPPASEALYLAAQVAAFRLGCAMLPLGQQITSAQAREQIERVGARFILSATEMPDCGPAWLADGVHDHVDGFPDARFFVHPGPPAPALDPGEVATSLILTSSGTTGIPKTVRLSEAMIFGFLYGLSASAALPALPALPCLVCPNISFDVTVADVWMSWIHGHRAVILATERRTPAIIAAAVALGARMMSLSPTLAAALLDKDPASFRGLEALHVVGEVFPLATARRLASLAPEIALINGYGPSEMAVLTTVSRVVPDEARVAIGHVLPGYRVLIADTDLRPLPPHWPGELLIASAAPALGYDDKAMTRAKFVEVAGEAPGLFFRSGDFGWIDERGRVQFIGRRDRQLKLHGIRVELDGIEHRIAEVEGVAAAAVVDVQRGGRQQVMAAVQLAADATDERALAARIVEHCRSWLPRAAIPADFTFMPAIPTGPSGKKAYAVIRELLARHDTGTQAHTVPTPNSIEGKLGELWSAALARNGIRDVAIHVEDDLFALGATSLDALFMAEQIEETYGIVVPDDQIFTHPTIGAQANMVRASRLTGFSAPRRMTTPRLVRTAATEETSGGALLGMPGLGGNAPYLGVVAANALHDFDIWTFDCELAGLDMLKDGLWLESARQIAARLMEPDAPRPRALLGFSLGGVIGWLVDRLLVAAGHKGIPVVNLDGGFPDIEVPGWQEHVEPLLPKSEAPPPTRMLLLQRGKMGRFITDRPSEAGWRELGVALVTRDCPTISHLDFGRAPTILAYADIIAAYVDAGPAALPRHPTTDEIDSPGGTLFRMLDGTQQLSSEAIVGLAESISHDDELHLGLIFVALALGDVDVAMDVTARMMAARPDRRHPVYARVALLAQLGRHPEADRLARSWCHEKPPDASLLARARKWLPRSDDWSQAARLFTDQPDAAMDFAAAFHGQGG
jgi:acyl-coenzyme A synthetase/AMP-(fatty) acid ligase/acyl carrier protein